VQETAITAKQIACKMSSLATMVGKQGIMGYRKGISQA
jgi:hypothetical protein